MDGTVFVLDSTNTMNSTIRIIVLSSTVTVLLYCPGQVYTVQYRTSDPLDG